MYIKRHCPFHYFLFSSLKTICKSVRITHITMNLMYTFLFTQHTHHPLTHSPYHTQHTHHPHTTTLTTPSHTHHIPHTPSLTTLPHTIHSLTQAILNPLQGFFNAIAYGGICQTFCSWLCTKLKRKDPYVSSWSGEYIDVDFRVSRGRIHCSRRKIST